MTATTKPRAVPRAVIVLSGPMTGLPDYNRQAFRAVAARLRANGYDVVSPAEYEIQPSATWGECLGVCLDAIRELQEQRLAGEVAPIIAVLPGADRSPGSAVERALAGHWGWARCDVPPRWCEMSDWIPARLDELRPLKNGWLEGRGIAPSPDGLDWLSLAFAQHYPEDLPLPFLYPTEEGGVRAEWSLEPHESSLDINLATHAAEWHVLNMETDKEDSRTLNLNEADDWKWLVEKIQEMTGYSRSRPGSSPPPVLPGSAGGIDDTEGGEMMTDTTPYSDPNSDGNSPKHHTGKLCINGCGRPAGTAWSPYWCYECNVERIDGINAQFEALTAPKEPTP